jgi:mRNA interferase MazF
MNTDARFVRGDVWSVDFGTDPEQAFRRPALIVSDDRLHHPNLRMVIVAPGTSTIRQMPLDVVVEPDSDTGLGVATTFQVEHVRAVSIARLMERLGHLGTVSRHAMDEILRNALGL